MLPVAEYDHSFGCSVTGGYVYRGLDFPALYGYYIYGDYCTGNIWALSRSDSGEWISEIVGDFSGRISSFGEDEDGELYLTNLIGGGVYRVTARAAPLPPRSPSGRIGTR